MVGWNLGISSVGQTVLARLIDSQIWHLPAGSVRGGFRKGTVASVHLSVWEESCPPALTMMPDPLFFLHDTGVFQTAAPVLELRRSELD